MAVASLGEPKEAKNLQKCTVLQLKMALRDSHIIVAVFLVFLVSSFSISVSFPLVSPYLPLFHPVLEPQNSPPNEVTGNIIYTEIPD